MCSNHIAGEELVYCIELCIVLYLMSLMHHFFTCAFQHYSVSTSAIGSLGGLRFHFSSFDAQVMGEV